jgi:phage tail sheath protein FI
MLPEFNTGSSKQTLSGGANGVPEANDVSPYIGSVSGGVYTGLQLFRNPEERDINLLATPGISDASVINEMINICETRADCMCIVDPPKGLNSQQVVDWHNGVGVYADHQAFNSSYAALYWPWLQIYDSVNKVDIWTPPSGHVAGAYAFNDYNAEAWYAPAGLNRGHLTVPKKAEAKPSLGERDLLYGNGNAVNPIATFVQQGINIWGQRTLQRKSSALDRVGVRRLMLYLEKVIATATRYLLFQPNNANTWTQFIDLVTPVLDGVQSRQGLTGFQVRCDATTNTADVIENNQMNALIFIKPTKTVEMIQLTMVLTAQGASFSEIVF